MWLNMECEMKTFTYCLMSWILDLKKQQQKTYDWCDVRWRFIIVHNFFYMLEIRFAYPQIMLHITKYHMICIFHSPWFSQQRWNMHSNLKLGFGGDSVLYPADTWRNCNGIIMWKGHFDLHHYYGMPPLGNFVPYNTFLPLLAINHASFL